MRQNKGKNHVYFLYSEVHVERQAVLNEDVLAFKDLSWSESHMPILLPDVLLDCPDSRAGRLRGHG